MAGPWRTLVDARTLHAHARDANLVLLDCRHNLLDPQAGEEAWKKGHLPGAFHAHLDRDLSGPITPRTGRHPVPDPDAFRESCSRWGVKDGVQVVAYDDRGAEFASRAWWLLRDYGHFDVACLDGGIQAWQAEGHALATGPPAFRPRSRFAGTPGHMPTVSAWDLTTRAPRRLLDARAPERYRGEKEPIDPVAGHIVGAWNFPTTGNLDASGKFLPPEKLRERYAEAIEGLRGKDVACYCGSGVTATHDVLALEIAGYPFAALYPGSWSEWIRDPRRPVAKGERP